MERWRREIRSFYDDTVDQIQRVVSGLSEVEAFVETSTRQQPRWNDLRDSGVSLPTRASASPPTEEDASQDRLANLKRELAAKLSNSGRDEAGQPR